MDQLSRLPHLLKFTLRPGLQPGGFFHMCGTHRIHYNESVGDMLQKIILDSGKLVNCNASVNKLASVHLDEL